MYTCLEISTWLVLYELPSDIFAVTITDRDGGITFPFSIRRPSVQSRGCGISYPGIGHKTCKTHAPEIFINCSKILGAIGYYKYGRYASVFISDIFNNIGADDRIRLD